MHSTYKGKIAVALVAAGSLLALAGCTGGGGDGDGGGSLEDMEPITLTWAEQGAEAQPYIAGLFGGGRLFMNYVLERTDKVTFEEYWGGSLFPTTESVQNLEAGVADVAQWSTSFTPNELPIENWYQILGSQVDQGLAFGYLQGSGATYEMHMRNQTLIDEYADHNIKIIMSNANVRSAILCRDEVTTLEQAQGKRTRVGGQVWAPEVEALGMSPQFMPFIEIYESLQRGVIDCVALPPNGFTTLGLTELAKHLLDVPLTSFIGFNRGINLDTWNSFPDELKTIFAEAGALESAAIANENMTQLAELILNSDENGVINDDATVVTAAIAERQAEIVAAMPDNAPAGVGDPQALIDEFLGYLDRWSGIVSETTPFLPGAEHGLVHYAENLPADYDWLDDYNAEFLAIAHEVVANS